MVDISIVDGGYKLTYNWGVPHWYNVVVPIKQQRDTYYLRHTIY